jgi:putative membrane protein
MRKHILLAAVASLALMPAAYAQSNKAGAAAEKSQSQIKPADQDFVTKAAIGGMFEVQSSGLADDKAQSAEVKSFAKQMIRDHGKADKELDALAEKRGATVPKQLDAKHAASLKKLDGLQGAAFDQEYIQAQRAAHKEAVGLFQSYSGTTGDPELTAWAGKILPTLKEHQSHVQTLNPGMAQGAGSSTTGRSATGATEPAKPSKQPMNKY